MRIGTKNYQLRIFNINGYGAGAQPVSVLEDARISEFSASINGGLGDLSFDLERDIDDWIDFTAFEKGAPVELWVQDIDTDDFIRIYAGYIADRNFVVTRRSRTVSGTCLGWVSRMATDIYRSGTTTTISETAGDPAQMFRNIIHAFRASNGADLPFINYFTTPNPSVIDTARSVNADFQAMTYRDAAEQCRQLAPSNYWWGIDEHNVVHFKPRPIQATHIFGIGMIDRMVVRDSLQGVVNGALVWDGSTNLRFFEDAVSRNQFGRRVVFESVPNAENTAAMDARARNVVGEKKDPRPVLRITVSDNNEFDDSEDVPGYDIEKIKVGDTCLITGFPEGVTPFLSENMVIRRIRYAISKIELDIEVDPESFEEEFLKFKKETKAVEKDGLPTTYTAI